MGTDEHVQLTVPIEWKAADDGTGSVEGLAAVFGNVDLGGDLIVKGAFKRTLDQWAKSKGRIPLVDGHLKDSATTLLGSVERAKETDKGLWFRARFSSDPGAQSVRTKALEGHLNGVSIGWLPVPGKVRFEQGEDGELVRILGEVKLFEISLTPIPMNPEARLASVKSAQSAKTAIGSHSTGTTDTSWDANAQRTRLPNSAQALAAAHAWRQAGGDADAKATYRFIHHMVGAGGEVGVANLIACSTGIGVLNGGRGGTTIPDADRQGVYSHLAKHLRDAGREPPELKAWMDFETFAEALRQALAIPVPMASKAAVDALLTVYRDPTNPGPADTDDTPQAASQDDAADPSSPAGTPAAPDDDQRGNPHDYAERVLANLPGPPEAAHPRSPQELASAAQTLGDMDRMRAEIDELLKGVGST
jgi:HK97 family phage prohead protease